MGWNNKTGVGFITPDDGGEHRAALPCRRERIQGGNALKPGKVYGLEPVGKVSYVPEQIIGGVVTRGAYEITGPGVVTLSEHGLTLDGEAYLREHGSFAYDGGKRRLANQALIDRFIRESERCINS